MLACVPAQGQRGGWPVIPDSDARKTNKQVEEEALTLGPQLPIEPNSGHVSVDEGLSAWPVRTMGIYRRRLPS